MTESTVTDHLRAGGLAPAAGQADRGARFGAVEIADLLGRPRPTPEQVAVIEAPLEPLLVVAGAGSGKTETMAARVVYLIANGLVAPDGVLGLTFTRKAAGELSERIRRRLRALDARLGADPHPGTSRGGRTPGDAGASGHGTAPDALLASMQRPTVATYNSYAASLVTEHALRLGLEPGAQLLGEASQWQLAHEVVETWSQDFETDAAMSTVVKAVRSLSAALSEHLLDEREARERMQAIVDAIEATPDAPGRSGPYAEPKKLLDLMRQRIGLLDLVAAYRRRKRDAESIDFADQVELGARLAETFPEVRAGERARFPVVLLDEYQDTSFAQARMLGALFGQGHCVTAVGDPNQSIYGWRGASASGLSRFAEQFDDVGGVHHAALSTSWRNDEAILRAANLVARPLRAEQVGLEVTELAARPGAGPGAVEAHFAVNADDEARIVADFVAEHWRPAGPAGRGERVTAAVLCRARSQFVPIEAALRSRRIPVEVVGLGGLLSAPEIVDLVALLQVVHDPSRGDSLMRLLTGPRLNLGTSDLFAIADRMRELARRAAQSDARSRTAGAGGPADPPGPEDPSDPDDGSTAVARESDLVDSHSIVDVLDELPRPGWTSHDGRSLTPQALERLQGLAELLAGLRARTYLSVPEIVREAERALGLDIEIGLGTPLEAHRARGNLDAFQDVALSFADGDRAPTLGAFLAWLDAAQSEERGLDQAVSEPDPDAVQIITVHAAKGLEWDVVAVPGLVDGGFPTTRANGSSGPQDSAWLTGLGTLPYPLRGDRQDLPAFAYRDAEDHKELNESLKDFRSAAGEYQVTEERRLAYVAMTRARSRLALTGSWFRSAIKPVSPSLFLTELVDERVVADADWAQPPTGDNPALDEAAVATWPDAPDAGSRPADAGRSSAVRLGAELVRHAIETRSADDTRSAGGAPPSAPAPPAPQPAVPHPAVPHPAVRDLAERAELLLAERAAGDRPIRDVELPAHISASALVRMAADAPSYALELRRPVPTRPSVHAHRGTRFHLWVERYFAAPSLVDLDDLPGGDEPEPDATLEALQESFLASPWALLEPVAVEVDVETPVAGIMTRSRIDAVFADPDRPGGFVVVDWKTGRPPSAPDAVRAREVQLAVYRLAWSRWQGVPLDRVSAAFYYASSGATVRPRELGTQADLEDLIRQERPQPS